MKNAASIRVYCLGHFRVEKDGAPLDGASRAQRKPLDLLKTLIALGGENVPEQQITDALWPDSDGDAAKQNFRTTLHRLRALIGPDALPLTRGSLSLDARLVWSDVHELAGHLQRAEGFLDSADASGAGQPALQAAALYTGPFLDGEFEPPEILTTREKLHGRFLRVLSEAGRALEKAGQPGEAIRLYQKGMEADPIAEELAQALMRAQLKEGRPSEAAAVYQRLRRSLEAQGPIAPSAETEAVWGEIAEAKTGSARREPGPELEEQAGLAVLTERGTESNPPRLSELVQALPGEVEPGSWRRWGRRTAIFAAAALVVAVVASYWVRSVVHLPQVAVSPATAAKPSLAVLPLNNMSGDPTLDYFSDGLAEDLITDLSQYRDVLVPARNSSFQFRKQRIDVRDAGKKLGVRYVLEGSVRQSEAKDMVRVTFQLADTRTGNHIWAERYDRKLEDVFALQEEIVDRVAVAIDVKLIQGDLTIRRRLSTKSYEAYKLYRRASELNLEFTPGANDQSIVLAMQALEIDPQFVLAWALIGWAHHSRAAFGWSRDPRRDLEIAWDNAQTALATNPDQVEALILAGFLQVYRHQYDDAHRLTARAVEIDPSDAVAAGVQGLVFNWSGAPELGLAKMKRAMEMSPVTPSWMDLELGNAQLMLRQHGDAIANLERAVQKTPRWLPARWLLAVAYAEAGRVEDAKRQFEKATEIDPSITLDHPNIQFDLNADKEFVKRIYAALRQAGLK